MLFRSVEVERRLRMIVAAAGGGPVSVPSPRRPPADQGRVEVAVVAEAEPSARSGAGGGVEVPPFTPALIRPLPAQRVAADRVGGGGGSARVAADPVARQPEPAPADSERRGATPAAARAEPAIEKPSPVPQFSRSTAAVAGLTLIAVLGVGGILAGFLVQRGDDRSTGLTPTVEVSSAEPSPPPSSEAPGGAAAGFSPAVCSGPAPRGAPTAPQTNAARGVGGFALMAGWSYFTDGTGLHMPVPDGWIYQKVGTTYCFRDPDDSDRVLSLDFGRNPAGDPVKACRAESTRLQHAGVLPDYRLITIEARPLLHKAADWEYTYKDASGAPLHAQTRWFATAGKAYAISWVTRQFDWTGNLPNINMVLSTFYADQAR